MAKKTSSARTSPAMKRLARKQAELDKSLRELCERYGEERVPARIMELVDKLEVALKRHLDGGTSLAARPGPQRKARGPRSSH
jgi:hypothetical protein